MYIIPGGKSKVNVRRTRNAIRRKKVSHGKNASHAKLAPSQKYQTRDEQIERLLDQYEKSISQAVAASSKTGAASSKTGAASSKTGAANSKIGVVKKSAKQMNIRRKLYTKRRNPPRSALRTVRVSKPRSAITTVPVTPRLSVSRTPRKALSAPSTYKPSGPFVDLPEEMRNAYVISIRSERWSAIQRRFGPWSKHLKMWRGTDGRRLNKNQWYREKKFTRRFGGGMTRGELGCYDSHARLWKKLASSNEDMALILEDDANINYNAGVANRLARAFENLKKNDVQWDIFYLGHYGKNTNQRRHLRKSNGNQVCPGVSTCPSWQGLFAYVLTKKGAQKLLRGLWPAQRPIDTYVQQHMNTGLKAIKLEPRLCYVVPVRSDTATIV